MYRNVVLVGLVAGAIGAGVGVLISGSGDEVERVAGQVQYVDGRLVTADGRPAGSCSQAGGRLDCELLYPLEEGRVRAEGIVGAGTSALAITNGSGPYQGAWGRVLVRPAADRRMMLDFEIVRGER
jgi:hypothetical protein